MKRLRCISADGEHDWDARILKAHGIGFYAMVCAICKMGVAQQMGRIPDAPRLSMTNGSSITGTGETLDEWRERRRAQLGLPVDSAPAQRIVDRVNVEEFLRREGFTVKEDDPR